MTAVSKMCILTSWMKYLTNTATIFKKQWKWSQHDVKTSKYIKYDVGHNDKDPNFKVSDPSRT